MNIKEDQDKVMYNCTNCGMYISINDKVCLGCGANLGGNGSAAGTKYKSKKYSEPGKWSKPIVKILILLILLSYGFMVYAELNEIWLGPLEGIVTNDTLAMGITGSVKLFMMGQVADGLNLLQDGLLRGTIGKANLALLGVAIILMIYNKIRG